MKIKILFAVFSVILSCIGILAEDKNIEVIQLDISNSYQVAWNFDLSMFAVLTGEEIWVWDTETWKLLYKIPDAFSYEIAWHPTENLIAGLNCCEGEKISIWNGETGELQIVLTKEVPEDFPFMVIRSALSWSSDGNYIATDSLLDTITLWNIDSQSYSTLVPYLESVDHDILNLSWSLSGQYLLSVGIDGYDKTSIRVWDAQTGENLTTVSGYKYVAWHPDEMLFAGAGFGNFVNIWNRKTGQLETSLAGHTHTLTSIDWNTNGVHIASTDADGNLIIWDVQTSEQLEFDFLSGEHVRGATWRPDGNQLAISTLENTTIFEW